MEDFKKIRVWHLAHELEMHVYRSCDPKVFARYPGLRSQTLRTANSIASNISEGSAKEGAEFARYLITAATFKRLVDKADLVRRMLIRLIKRIRADD